MLSKNAKKVKKNVRKLIETMGWNLSDTWRYIRKISIVIILEDGSFQRITFPVIHKSNRRSIFHRWGIPAVQFFLKDRLIVNTNYANLVDFLKLMRNSNLETHEANDTLTFILSKSLINRVYYSVFEINKKFYQIDDIFIRL